MDALDDPRAHLQQRVARFTGASCVFFALLLAFDFASPGEGEATLSSTRIACLVVLVTHGAAWAYARAGVRPFAALRAVELAAMIAAMAVYGTLPLVPPLPGGGGVMAFFTPIPMAVLVLLRAAVIPSPAWLSALVALVWGGVMTASNTLGWEGVELHIADRLVAGGEPPPPWLFPLGLGALTTAAFTFVAAVTSHVVYGLETKVREALELGQYRLEAKIGEGGMGVVYRARHRLLQRPTAVKLLPPAKAGERAIARFEREVRQTTRLTHPNTVAIYDYGRSRDGLFYYAMEYLDGVSLQALVDTWGPLPPARAVHLLVQVADALAEAHSLGLVHRDVKPDNVMVCERGRVPDFVKVLDFGLVKDVRAADGAEQLSTTDTIQGTPLYMAPEALVDPDAIDGRADVYALGAVGWFLLVGRPLFCGGVVEVLGHHLHTAPASLAEAGGPNAPELEAVLRRCLEKAPTARFASADDLSAALRATPEAGAWRRSAASAWWDAHRGTIARRHDEVEVPTTRTLARG